MQKGKRKRKRKAQRSNGKQVIVGLLFLSLFRQEEQQEEREVEERKEEQCGGKKKEKRRAIRCQIIRFRVFLKREQRSSLALNFFTITLNFPKEFFSNEEF